MPQNFHFFGAENWVVRGPLTPLHHGKIPCMYGPMLAGGLSHPKIILILGPCPTYFILDPMHLGKDQQTSARPFEKHLLGENPYRYNIT
jgi:hypothetical protein